MSSADELFLNGQIRPLKLSSHLQRPQSLVPLLDLEPNEVDDLAEEAADTSGGSGGATRDAESLFRTKPIPEIRAVETSVRREIQEKKEELRQLVGRSYRDLIDSADSILLMKSSCESISSNLAAIDAAFASLSTEAEALPKSPAAAAAPPRPRARAPSASQTGAPSAVRSAHAPAHPRPRRPVHPRLCAAPTRPCTRASSLTRAHPHSRAANLQPHSRATPPLCPRAPSARPSTAQNRAAHPRDAAP